jgi:class 3 adenylate cyclase
MNHVGGVDTSELFVCRIGVRNDNDLVWVGRAANYAAKLSEISNDYPIFISGDVFDKLHKSAKNGAGGSGPLMWEERSWTAMNKMRVYRSNWIWEP